MIEMLEEILQERIREFSDEVNNGIGSISKENARLLWKILFDAEPTYEELQAILKSKGRKGNLIVDKESFKEENFSEDDFIIKFDHLYDQKRLMLVIDEYGTLKIAREPKKSDNPYYGEHGDYVYRHTLPKRLLKLIIARNGKLNDNMDLLRLLPEEVREPLTNIEIKDFQKLAIEAIKRPIARKYYYLIFSKGEKISIERTYNDDKPWSLIEGICNRSVKSFVYDIAKNKVSDVDSYEVIITNEKYLLSRYRFCMTYEEFLFVFEHTLPQEALNYLERVFEGKLDKAFQVNGNTSVFDESEGQTYYCDDHLLWKEE